MKKYIYKNKEYFFLADLRKELANISFPQNPSDEILNSLGITVTEYEIPLSELKTEKLSQLLQKQREFEQNFCSKMKITSSLGYVMDADIRSQTNMQGLIDVGQFPVTYICGDNVARQLSLEDLQTVKKECILNGQNLYAQKWALQEKIGNAQSKEELEAIEISFVMLDFSVKNNSDEDNISQS